VKESSNRTNLYKYIQRTEQLYSYTIFNADTVPQRDYVYFSNIKLKKKKKASCEQILSTGT